MKPILVATESNVVVCDADRGTMAMARGLDARPSCLAADPLTEGRAWCGTSRGVFRSDDAGETWRPAGLLGLHITAISASPARNDLVWVGTEPSEVWQSTDGGDTWDSTRRLGELPSSSEWSFPPRPDTHHVRWIACHPTEPGRLWVAIEAGALVFTPDGGSTWLDRVLGGPFDTHELAIHSAAPETLRVAAGDGYFESRDSGTTWSSPSEGLDVGYFRSVAVDPSRPDVVILSGSSGPFTAYMAGRADGRVYRRAGRDRWERVRDGWPKTPATIAPLLASARRTTSLWAADERGVHRSDDAGVSWRRIAGYPTAPQQLRGFALASSTDAIRQENTKAGSWTEISHE